VNTYAASGEQVAAAGARVTFEGPWSLVSSTCAPDLQDAVWTDESGRSHATFAFAGDATTLDQWIQHRDADDTEPLPGASDQGQWYITALGQTLSGGQATHSEDETTLLEGLIPLTPEHEFTVRFSED
jgi:hypothetical protein